MAEIDPKPKIILSAATQTKALRTTFKLINKRLKDVLIVDNDYNLFLELDQQSGSISAIIDAYLQTRQIAIINRQTADKIQELNNIVKSWKGNVDRADETLIPDSATDTNPENYWSLRTLFPKQVNRIGVGIDVEENKNYIYEVLNELNFRKIYKWIVFNHGVIDGININTLCTENKELVANRLAAIRYIKSEPNLCVSDKSDGDYKVFSTILDSNLETFPNECLNNIRAKIKCSEKKKSHTNTIVFINNSKKMNKTFEDEGLIKSLAEFGVYIGDISFMYCSIKTDNKHHFTNPPLDYNPKLEIKAEYIEEDKGRLIPSSLTVTVSIENGGDTAKFEKWEKEDSLQAEATKIERKLMDNPYNIVLRQQAIKDFVGLFINRYKADVEIQFGKKRLTVISKNRTPTIVETTLEKTEYVFTIKTI